MPVTLDHDRLKLEHRNPRLRDERREAERLQAETACRTRGAQYTSRSGRNFRAAIVDNPQRRLATTVQHVDGAQLLLDLCNLHEKPARVPRQVSREAHLLKLEVRGANAFEELGAPVGKRSVSAVLTYLSQGGEILARPSSAA